MLHACNSFSKKFLNNKKKSNSKHKTSLDCVPTCLETGQKKKNNIRFIVQKQEFILYRKKKLLFRSSLEQQTLNNDLSLVSCVIYLIRNINRIELTR